MNKHMITGGALAGLLIAGGLVGTVSAQSAAEATGLTEEQAIELALTEVPGEVLEAELEHDGGTHVFEIEIMSEDGVETEVAVSATTGQIIEVAAEGDDDRERRCHKNKDGDEDEDDGEDA